MLIVMNRGASQEQVDKVVGRIEAMGMTARPIPGGERVAVAVLYNTGRVEESAFLELPGVKETIAVTKPYKLVSRETQPEDTQVRVGNALIGNSGFTVIAGPCAVEGEKQALVTAQAVKEAGATIFRGGAFKPRTSPYSFQGLGLEGLKILARVREETGLPVVTEAVDQPSLEMIEEYADMIQIGTRNMQNFSLLRMAGKARKPVMLKRGMSATIDEWLMAAEYLMEEGNHQVVLCERGVRTFARHSRNTLDLSAVPVVRKESHLPVLVDPSHAAGRRDQVMPLSRASLVVGAHGIMVEVHHDPERAMSDGAQSLYPEQFTQLQNQLQAIAQAFNNHHEPAVS